MAKNDGDPRKKLAALMDKALRRGEKLERTLTKLAGQLEPDPAIEDFLKAVQRGLKAVRKNAKSSARSSDGKKSSKAKAAGTEAPKKSAKKAAPKKPAPADLRLLPKAG